MSRKSGRMTGLVVVGAMALGGLLLGALPAGAQADGASVAKALIDAENNRDVEGAVVLFTDDAVVVDPSGRFTTRVEIRQWQTTLSQSGFRANINPPTVAGTRVTFTGGVATDRLRGLGLDRLDAAWDLTVEAGRIKAFTFAFTPDSAVRLQQALARAQAPAPFLPLTGGEPRPGLLLAGLALALGALLVRAVRPDRGA